MNAIEDIDQLAALEREVVALRGIYDEHAGFGESYASCGRVANVIPVDVAVPGCPPSSTRILQGILTAVTAAKGAGTAGAYE